MKHWIFLRGLARESRHWGDFARDFERELPGTAVTVLDLPGNGSLHDMTSPVSIDRMAAHCRNELARRGITPPCNLLAMSMGGMVATAWAARWPGEIESIVLVNSSFANFSPLQRRLQRSAWPSLWRIAVGADAAIKESQVFALTSRQPTMPEATRREWLAIRESQPVSNRNVLRQLLAAARYRAPPSPPADTLVLASRQDALVDVRCSEDIARQWRCPIALHASAGHDLVLDDPRWVTTQMRDWIRRTATRS